MPKFIPGKKLSRLFFKEVVEPILKDEFPKLKYSAGLLGKGSEVLGFDTERSRDHDWGPRVMLFVSKKDFGLKKEIYDLLSVRLPYSFRGYSTHFGDVSEKGVGVTKRIDKGKIAHRVSVYTIDSFFKDYLKVDLRKKFDLLDWLRLPEQKLRAVTQGEVFRDDLRLKKVIAKFSYYPRDVWLYLLASQWTRISQEEHFMGRTAEVKDELGSRILTAKLVRDLMRLCFLMEKEYAPYIKWFGTGFSKLKSAKKLNPILEKAIDAHSWKQREKYLSRAYEFVAKEHNKLKITRPLSTKVTHFFGRPFLVIHAGRFADEIGGMIKSKKLRSLPRIGGASQFIDSTDVLEGSDTSKIKALYK